VIRNLQALRAIAAMLVMFVHLDKSLHTVGLPSFGGSGVDLFFVVSGFVMVHTTKDRSRTAGQFAKDRIARIVPIYWLMTVAVFALAIALPRLFQSTQADPIQLAKSLLFIPFMKQSGLIQPILFVGWSLNYEMFFYVLFAIGLLAPRYWIGLAWVVAALILLVVGAPLTSWRGVAATFYTRPIMLEFALGIGLALTLERMPKSAPRAAKWALLLLGAIALGLAVSGPKIWPYVPPLLTAGLPATVVVGSAIVIERWGWRLKSDLVVLLGNASYMFYLSHPFVSQVAENVNTHLHSRALVAVGIILALGAACLVGVVLHKLVELPLSRGARKLLTGARPGVEALS
jgi:exopolysaccharide production protein ExoZ